MIKSVRLKNWKSFSDATLFIDPLTIMIGMNASGKSNVLDALLFLQRVASGLSIAAAIAGDANITPLRGGLEWCTKIFEKNFSIEVVVKPDHESKVEYLYHICVETIESRCRIYSEYLKRLDNDRSLYYTQNTTASPALLTYFATGKRGAAKRLDQNPAFAVLSQTETINIIKEIKDVSRKIRDQLQSIFILDPIPSHMRNYSPLSDTLKPDASNIAGVIASIPEEQRLEVEAALTSFLKKLPEKDVQKVWTERIGKFQSDAMLYCEEKWTKKNSQLIDTRGMSDGTLRFIAIIGTLLTCKKTSLLVIEEVDNGLHPSRAETLVSMLKNIGTKRNIDIIITTHNPAILNALGPEMVPFISVLHRDKNGKSKITLLEDIDNLAKIMAIGPLGRVVSEGRIEAALKRNLG